MTRDDNIIGRTKQKCTQIKTATVIGVSSLGLNCILDYREECSCGDALWLATDGRCSVRAGQFYGIE